MRLVSNIKEQRINFFLELLNSFDFVTIENDAPELSFAEKQFIEDRLLHHAQNKEKSGCFTTKFTFFLKHIET